MKKYAVGIDLGTTNSCVAAWINDRVEIISNDQGFRTTPSYVSFQGSDILVGLSAKNDTRTTPKNIIYDSKRLIGKKYNLNSITQESKYWQFELVEDNNFFGYKIDDKIYSPEQIGSFILSKLKIAASNYLGIDVVDVVITVPAYFNDSQRMATQDAATIAGLNVIRIINEPTAAAFAYGLDKKDNSIVLIFDTGGGTHDVSLLHINNGVFKVLATAGNTKLGGEDFDNIICDYIINEFTKKHKLDITNNSKSIKKVKLAAEQAKILLTSQIQVDIDIDSLMNGIDFSCKLTRGKFENMCNDLFKKTIEPIEQVLKDAKIDKSKVDEIVLVGGSTRIPKIKNMISEYFGGKKLNESVNPDEAVAYGAAVQAAILSDIQNNVIQDLMLVDLNPLSLGIETAGGLMSVIIPRNTTIPLKRTQTYSTYSDNQSSVIVKIFEGEREFTKDNNLLGTFVLMDIEPAKRGEPKIDVTFELNADGILNVTAHNKMNNTTKKICIQNDRKNLDSDKIEKMIQEAKQYEESDKLKRKIISKKNEVETQIYIVEKLFVDKNINAIQRKELEQKSFELLECVNNANDLDEINKLWNEFEIYYTDLYTRVNEQ